MEKKLVYWENQASDRLCGVHCVNSLLQGPHYDLIKMTKIAQELDKKEKEITGYDGPSNNVDHDGNFSLAALSETLKHFKEGIVVESIDHPSIKEEIAENPDKEIGFIVNSKNHWFCIRKTNNDSWWNLNSTNKEPGPQFIKNIGYVLMQLKQSNYTVLSVRGELPDVEEKVGDLFPHQKYFTVEELMQNHNSDPNRELNFLGTDERDLEIAIKNSMMDAGISSVPEESPNAFPSLDDELVQALTLSMQQMQGPSNDITVNCILIDGSTFTCSLPSNATIKTLLGKCVEQPLSNDMKWPQDSLELMGEFGSISDQTLTLEQSNINSGSTVFVSFSQDD